MAQRHGARSRSQHHYHSLQRHLKAGPCKFVLSLLAPTEMGRPLQLRFETAPLGAGRGKACSLDASQLTDLTVQVSKSPLSSTRPSESGAMRCGHLSTTTRQAWLPVSHLG